MSLSLSGGLVTKSLRMEFDEISSEVGHDTRSQRLEHTLDFNGNLESSVDFLLIVHYVPNVAKRLIFVLLILSPAFAHLV